jgi:ferric-dicitrate binding protein FerR (iron transport regulator)
MTIEEKVMQLSCARGSARCRRPGQRSARRLLGYGNGLAYSGNQTLATVAKTINAI